MGTNWSCYSQEKEKNELKIEYTETEKLQEKQNHTPSLLSENEDPLIDKKVQVQIQSLARGYLDRKVFFPSFRTYKNSVKLLLPQDAYEPVSIEDYLEMQGTLSDYIIKSYGHFDNENPLSDGIPVEEFQPLRLYDGVVYKGEWNEQGNKHGRGCELFPNGTQFIGYFSNGKREGEGRLVEPNGNFYQGSFSEGKSHGFGVYIHEDGSTYRGYFVNDLQEGKGKETYPDGSYYRGEYENGMKHGKGLFKWKDGKKYKGEFKNNEITGYGVYVWPNGKMYEGEWLNGKMHGKGVFVWKDGRKYEGEYFEDKKHGFGVFTWVDGKRFEGYWKEGLEHGKGKIVYLNEENELVEKEGEWERGRLKEGNNLEESLVNL